MAKVTELEMEAVKRLNFKDSGKGAGVQGSLVAIQEMLSGDMVSLQRRFEIGGDAINRIKAAGDISPEKQVEQLIKELETMGVTEEALKKVQGSTKAKMDRIGETLTDFFTNPNTGIMASLIAPFEPVVDKITNFLETGGGIVSNIPTDIPGVYDQITQLDVITEQFRQVLGKIGDFGLKLGESFFSGFVAQVDWSALWSAVSDLLDTISTFFTPAFEILSGWVNDTFIPWLGEINTILQNEETKQGILDFIKGLTDIATRSLEMISTIADKMPLIADVTTSVNDFLGGVQDAVDSIASAIQKAKKKLAAFNQDKADIQAELGNGFLGGFVNSFTNGVGHAAGLPYVPRDGYQAILHKGERVLTAQQNRQYNQGGSNVSIPKLADTIVIREDADIDMLTTKLVKKLKTNMLSYGGAY